MKKLLVFILMVSISITSYANVFETDMRKADDRELVIRAVDGSSQLDGDDMLWYAEGDRVTASGVIGVHVYDTKGEFLGDIEVPAKVGDVAPAKIFQLGTQHYGMQCNNIKYNSTVYGKTNPFVTQDMYSNYISVTVLNEIILVQNNTAVNYCSVRNLGRSVDHNGNVITISNDLDITNATLHVKYSIVMDYVGTYDTIGTSNCSVGFNCSNHEWWKYYNYRCNISGILGGFDVPTNSTQNKEIEVPAVRNINVDGTAVCTKHSNKGDYIQSEAVNRIYYQPFTVNIEKAWLAWE